MRITIDTEKKILELGGEVLMSELSAFIKKYKLEDYKLISSGKFPNLNYGKTYSDWELLKNNNMVCYQSPNHIYCNDTNTSLKNPIYGELDHPSTDSRQLIKG